MRLLIAIANLFYKSMNKFIEKLKKIIKNQNFSIEDTNLNYVEYKYTIDKNENELIRDSIDKFISNVEYISKNFTLYNVGVNHTGYKIFDPASQDYFAMTTLEERMETYIRDNLILDIIYRLFSYNNYKILIPKDDKCYAWNRPCIIDKLPLAFIVNYKNKNIAYRLSNISDDAYDINVLNLLIEKYNINQIEIIVFDEKLKENYSYFFDLYKVPISKILYKDFFTMYFTNINYNEYMSMCKDAVKYANNYLGFHTIPCLSERYNYKLRMKLINKIIHIFKDNDFFELTYEKVNSEYTNKYFKEINIEEKEYNVLKKNIIGKSMYNCLFGDNDFADSLLSSEYLYETIIEKSNMDIIENSDFINTNVNNYGFDYTVIACGYLKSLEQLLFILFDMYTRNNDDKYLMTCKVDDDNKSEKQTFIFIKNNGKEDVRYVKVITKTNDNIKKLELGSLIYFMHINLSKYYFDSKLEEALFGQLLQFSQECRNGYFHKDNIQKLNVLKKIRNNTFYLINMIIGGYDFLVIDGEYKNSFNYHNFDYEKLYLQLYEISNHVDKFKIKFTNESINVKIKEKLSEPKFDKRGQLNQKYILVYREEDDKAIVIDENNIPIKMWYKKCDKNKTLVEILW